MDFNVDLLQKLVSVYGPSGDESLISATIRQEISEYVDEITTDALGNLIARKRGSGKKIMVSAHMDQIGFIVTDIDKEGFLRFGNVGGISPDISLSQRVIFKNGTVGAIFSEPIEKSSERKLENMYIDIGAKNKESAEKLVNVGDMCIYYSPFASNENVVFTPYLDDRAGCFVAIEALKRLPNTENDVYFVFSVQEEVGLRGARTAAYGIEPDFGIAVDVTAHGDTPKAKRFAIGLHKGAAIKVKDNSIITHPSVRNVLIEIAKEKNIPYQLEVLEFGGTDSGAIHISKTGVPSGVISIPTRYVHSTVEMASKEDIESSITLLEEYLTMKH
ncbi:M42 family metallopeptidase [Gudongella sp. DL1XJH-153]|uniref:M42 family metallopeptidase n=1 Tax=Gudongella sp. DL1XJH-153 TaxID=3409804 RepID=UPI003BB4C23A